MRLPSDIKYRKPTSAVQFYYTGNPKILGTGIVSGYLKHRRLIIPRRQYKIARGGNPLDLNARQLGEIKQLYVFYGIQIYGIDQLRRQVLHRRVYSTAFDKRVAVGKNLVDDIYVRDDARQKR